MGFCLINNIAVVAANLAAAGRARPRPRLGRPPRQRHRGHLLGRPPGPLRLDPPVRRFYPGTGALDDVGGPGARGATLNLPFPAGATGDVYLRALDEVVAPAVERVRPDVGAGLGRLRRPPGRPAHRPGPVGRRLRRPRPAGGRYAPGPGRLVLFLEGGYDLDALTTSVGASLAALARRPLPARTGHLGRPRAQRSWKRPGRSAAAAQRPSERSCRSPGSTPTSATL